MSEGYDTKTNFTKDAGNKCAPDENNRTDRQILKDMIENERWTIEYYATMPSISVMRPPTNHTSNGSEPRTTDYSRLCESRGTTQIWGCRICHKFYNYPTRLMDDLIKNHKIPPEQIMDGKHIIRLRVENADLFRMLTDRIGKD